MDKTAREVDPRIAIMKSDLKKLRDGIIKCKNKCSNHREKSFDYRHLHIAYCELRGRTRAQIEKPRDDNKASEQKIAMLKVEYGLRVKY
ncbi:hypothetical protein KKH82_08620 [Patescibacteria group bacterium]|nr:hypothetical protein [Patescibacteria group bacterium]